MVKPNASGERADAIIEALLRQIDPLARAKGRDEWLSAADIAAHLGQQLGAQVNRSTIFRAMQDLLGKGLVQASGETKSRRYRLSGAPPASGRRFRGGRRKLPARHEQSADRSVLRLQPPGRRAHQLAGHQNAN